MALKVAIVGMSPATHDLAPFGDREWETWGLPWDGDWSRMTRTFEIHDAKLFDDRGFYPPGYRERLEHCPGLYLQRGMVEYPDAVPYPLEAVTAAIGRDYFQSSVAYMIALAIHEGASEIALCGVDMGDDTEYGYQKANAEYLLGIAAGRGIRVHIPEVSPVCKYAPVFDYKTRYGWDA